MSDGLSSIIEYLSNETSMRVIRALILVAIGFVLAKVLSDIPKRLLRKRLDRHQIMIAKRAIFYTVLALFLASALRQLGFQLGVLLGAAGILTVAIGFASQTSASNLISGLFLIGEKPFGVGDIIRVGDTTGEVLSIDPLSVKLRTFDNLYVRIPNETLIKSEVTTLTKFPIRRFDFMLGVAYKEDIGRVREILEEVAEKNNLCLVEPKPLFIFQGLGESSLDIQFSVWAKRENFLALRNSIQEEVKLALDAAGIEIPFPHRTLYTGALTDPLPVHIVGDGNESRGRTLER